LLGGKSENQQAIKSFLMLFLLRAIKHLGSIEEKPDRLSAIYFWFSFQKNLKGLKLTDSKKNEITAKVAGRIPKVTDREFYQLQSFCRSGEHPEKEKDSFKRLIKRHLPRFSVW
jgi:hypothetical protein